MPKLFNAFTHRANIMRSQLFLKNELQALKDKAYADAVEVGYPELDGIN